MGWLIYNNTPQQEALMSRLNSALENSDIPQGIKDGFTQYTEARLHPSNGQVAIAIKTEDYYWPYVQAELTVAEENSIVEILTSDWFA